MMLNEVAVILLILILTTAKKTFIQKVVEENTLESVFFDHCKAKGECFSGAWLGTVKHLLDNPLIEEKFPNETIPKSPNSIRCEDASFYFFHHMFEVKWDPHPHWGMSPVQTIDLLDFSVLHLSTLERGQRHCLRAGMSPMQKINEKIVLNQEAARALRNLRMNYFNTRESKASSVRKRSMDLHWANNPISSSSHATPSSASAPPDAADLTSRAFARTLVVMPFLVTTKGESATTTANKKLYFKLCFDSLYPLFRNIIGAVINKEDQAIMKDARPFRDVLLFRERKNDCELPVRALLSIKRMLKTDPTFAAAFDFIYFTEGDQVLFGRHFPQIFSFLTKNPYTVLTPHRLVLTPPCVLAAFNRSAAEMVSLEDMSAHSCCLDTSSYGLSRSHWKPLASPQTTLLRLFGMAVVAGNGDLFSQTYRICNITARRQACPRAPTFLDQEAVLDRATELALIVAPHMKDQAKLYYTATKKLNKDRQN